MARLTREIKDNAYYHLVNRGVNRKPTYYDSQDYRSFLQLLEIGCSKYGVRVIALALMPNHFHILIWTIFGSNVSPWIKWVTGVYAQSFNKRHERTGHLWQDRYFAREVQEGRHLGTTWRYVEQNPVRACITDTPHEWEWSSAYHRSKNKKPDYLFEPPWWGSEIMKEWWSEELLDAATLDKVRRSLQQTDLLDGVVDWGHTLKPTV